MTPRDPHRRARLLAAARDQIVRDGLRGLRTDAVAAEAGVSKGALFLEFPSKEQLLVAVVTEILDASRARYVAQVLPIVRPLLRLRATLRFVFDERAREPVFDRLLRDDPELRALRGYADAPDQRAQADAEIAMLGAWLAEGVADGTVRADLPLHVVPFVLSLLRFCHDHTALATGGRVGRDEVLDLLVDLFVAGLATEEGRALLRAEEGR